MKSITVDQVANAIREVLLYRDPHPAAVAADTTLEELGLESLDIAEALVLLEEIAGCELEISSPRRITTVAGLHASLAFSSPT